MNIRRKRNSKIFTYNGYLVNHKDYNSKGKGILNCKVIVFIIILIFILISIIWILKQSKIQ